MKAINGYYIYDDEYYTDGIFKTMENNIDKEFFFILCCAKCDSLDHLIINENLLKPYFIRPPESAFPETEPFCTALNDSFNEYKDSGRATGLLCDGWSIFNWGTRSQMLFTDLENAFRSVSGKNNHMAPS